MNTPTYRDDLRAHLAKLTYDFAGHVATLHLPAGDCPDQAGVIALISILDAELRETSETQEIRVYSGGRLDVRYLRSEDGWSEQRTEAGA